MPKTHQRRGQCLIHRNTGSSELTCKSTGNLCLPPREDDLRHQNRSVKINGNIKRALILLYCVVLFQKAAAKKVDWRKKHDNFMKSVRAAREIDEAIKTGTLINQCIVLNNHFFPPSGAPVPSYQASEPNPDYVQCPYCKRRFQESAAERHIPFCKEQNARLEHNPASVKAKQSLSKRMQVCPIHQPNEQIV